VFSTPLASRKSPQWLLLVLLLLSTLFTAQRRSLVQATDSAAELPQGLNLKDIKFTPDPDDITGACQMAVLRGDLAKGPSAIAYKSATDSLRCPDALALFRGMAGYRIRSW
jgi:hypothetical protein